MRDQLDALRKAGPAVLLKGGHLAGPECPDLLAGAGRCGRAGPADRAADRDDQRPRDRLHAVGGDRGAAAAARPDWLSAVTDAKAYLTAALAAADRLTVGGGRGPVHHFHAWW